MGRSQFVPKDSSGLSQERGWLVPRSVRPRMFTIFCDEMILFLKVFGTFSPILRHFQDG